MVKRRGDQFKEGVEGNELILNGVGTLIQEIGLNEGVTGLLLSSV